MATLADNKRDFLLASGITSADLDKMEKDYYASLSGLAYEPYSVTDHKRAYFAQYLGLSNVEAGQLSISDLERRYLGATVSKSLNDAWNDFYGNIALIKSLGPLAWHDSRFPNGFNSALPADSAPVGAWADLSGNGHVPTQAIVGRQPLFKKMAGGLPAPSLQFDGIDDELIYNLPATAAPFTVYVVAKAIATTPTGTIFVSNSEPSIYTSNSSPYLAIWNDPGGGVNASGLSEQTAPIVVSATWGPTTTIYANGIQGDSVAGSIYTLGTDTYIGAEYSVKFFPGHIYSVIVYADDHNTATRKSIERALGAVYGIGVA